MTGEDLEVAQGELVAVEDDLTRLGDEVRVWSDRADRGVVLAYESSMQIGKRLLAARQLLPADQDYGRWFKGQRFPFSQRWGVTLRLAAEHEDAVREAVGSQLLTGAQANIEAAVKAITRAERAEQRELAPAPPPVLPGSVRVLHRDARDWHGDEGHADLAIFSPPYNVGVGYAGDDTGDGLPHDEWLDLLDITCKVLVEGWGVGRICINTPAGIGRTPYRPLLPDVLEVLGRQGGACEGVIVWDKATTGNRTTWGSWRNPKAPALRDRTEIITVWRTDNPVEPTGLVDDGTGKMVSPWLDADTFTTATQDLWTIAPESAKRAGHPAPFPEALADRLIRLYGWPTCTVIDPFAGSGTTGLAAVRLGADAVLIERSRDYCDLITRRLAEDDQ